MEIFLTDALNIDLNGGRYVVSFTDKASNELKYHLTALAKRQEMKDASHTYEENRISVCIGNGAEAEPFIKKLVPLLEDYNQADPKKRAETLDKFALSFYAECEDNNRKIGIDKIDNRSMLVHVTSTDPDYRARIKESAQKQLNGSPYSMDDIDYVKEPGSLKVKMSKEDPGKPGEKVRMVLEIPFPQGQLSGKSAVEILQRLALPNVNGQRVTPLLTNREFEKVTKDLHLSGAGISASL